MLRCFRCAVRVDLSNVESRVADATAVNAPITFAGAQFAKGC